MPKTIHDYIDDMLEITLENVDASYFNSKQSYSPFDMQN